MKFKDFSCAAKSPSAALSDHTAIAVDLDARGILFPEVFYDPAMYADYARYLHADAPIIALPLDHALEAEAYGAEIVPGNALYEMRVREPKSGTPADIADLPLPDFSRGRFATIFTAGEKLQDKGVRVGLNLTGPYTFYSALVPLKRLLITGRRDPEVVTPLLLRLAEIHVAIAQAALEHGFSFVSLGDPTGSLTVLGPTAFARTLTDYVVPLIKTLITQTDSRILLCPKYRSGLETLGIISGQAHTFDTELGYDEAIDRIFSEARIFGDRCPNDIKPSRQMLTYRLSGPVDTEGERIVGDNDKAQRQTATSIPEEKI